MKTRCIPATRFDLRKTAIVSLATAMLCAFVPQAFAERADKDKPAIINADKSSGDDLNQTSIYTGDVVLTKGTIILRADQLTTRQDPEGYSYGTAIVTQPGKLAYFKQKREGVDEYIEGQAERIEYDEKSDTVKLFNRAIVKRLAAGRDADEIRGDRIDYNSRTEIYNAQSNDAPTAGGKDNKRVRVVLQPKIKPGASDAPGSNGVPSGPTSATPLDLKKEPAIEKRPGS
jgi:lipopolysaccharide export system protein LptA